MIGVDEGLLGRTVEEIFGMMGKELVQRSRRGDHDGCGRFETASRATRLLPRRSDGTRVADEDRRAQPADVDPQFEGVCGNNGLDSTLAQSLFDLATLGWQISAAITTDG